MKKKWIIIISVMIVIVVIISICAFRTDLKTVHYEFESEKVQNEIRLAFISDLHSCSYGENQEQIIEELEKFSPHAVLFGGDIIDDVMPEDAAKILLKGVAEKYPSFYVSGNHEWWSGRMYEYFDFLDETGVKSLRGECAKLKVGEDVINICGIDDPEYNRKYPSTSWEAQLENALGRAEKDLFTVLVAHRPEHGEIYMEYDVDLCLSGHAHGGQGRIPFLLNGLYAPNQGFFPKYAGGEYDFEGKKFIVSRGLSRENTKLPRIFNRPELVFITIKPQ